MDSANKRQPRGLLNAAELARVVGARPSGDWWRMLTVCHGGDGFNLSFRDGDRGGIVFRCHSRGCDYATVKAAIERAHGVRLGGLATPADRQRAFAVHQQRQAERRRDRAKYDLLVSVDATSDAVAARLAALCWAGVTERYHGEADALTTRYHALRSALREVEANAAA